MDYNLKFLPINNAHAIVECIIFVEFLPVFSHAVRQKLVGLAPRLKDELPKSEPKNVVEHTIIITPEGPKTHVREELSGIELQRFRTDGNLEWMLRTTENIISVHCLDYTRWENVWDTAKKYLEAAFEQIQESGSFVNAIGIKYIDRFVYQDDVKNYKVSDLFSENTELLANKLFNSGPLWHSHIGWFEKIDGIDFPCLNQVNIDATYADFSGLKKPVTTIEHTAILNADEYKRDISSFIEYEDKNDENSKFDKMIFILHNINKEVLISLLNVDLKQKINISNANDT